MQESKTFFFSFGPSCEGCCAHPTIIHKISIEFRKASQKSLIFYQTLSFQVGKHLPMYRKQTLELCHSIFLFMAYFYFTDGVIKFNEKLDCRMDVVFFSNLIDMFESYSIHITLEIVSRLKNCSSRTIFFFWLKPNWMILISFLIDFMIRHLTYSCGQKSFIQSF